MGTITSTEIISPTVADSTEGAKGAAFSDIHTGRRTRMPKTSKRYKRSVLARNGLISLGVLSLAGSIVYHHYFEPEKKNQIEFESLEFVGSLANYPNIMSYFNLENYVIQNRPGGSSSQKILNDMLYGTGKKPIDYVEPDGWLDWLDFKLANFLRGGSRNGDEANRFRHGLINYPENVMKSLETYLDSFSSISSCRSCLGEKVVFDESRLKKFRTEKPNFLYSNYSSTMRFKISDTSDFKYDEILDKLCKGGSYTFGFFESNVSLGNVDILGDVSKVANDLDLSKDEVLEMTLIRNNVISRSNPQYVVDTIFNTAFPRFDQSYYSLRGPNGEYSIECESERSFMPYTLNFKNESGRDIVVANGIYNTREYGLFPPERIRVARQD